MAPRPYSYRADPDVPAFDDTAPLLIFDGLCVLCSSGVAWMLARDPHGSSRFAAIQDPLPRALYRHYGLDPEAFDTFLVLRDGIPYTKWAGVVAAGQTLPQPWRALASAGRVIPSWLGDPIYDWVQRNRIRWFGTRSVCRRPSSGEASRFLSA